MMEAPALALHGQPIFYDPPRPTTNLVYVGPKMYQAFKWEVEERHRWAGRDWRRIKRERRKFVRAAPHE